MKLDEHDYHAIADAAMDLRELEVELKMEEKIYQQSKAIASSGSFSVGGGNDC